MTFIGMVIKEEPKAKPEKAEKPKKEQPKKK